MSAAEAIKSFRVLSSDFSEDPGELTSTLKVRPASAPRKLHDEVEAIYQIGRRRPMADDDNETSGGIPRSVNDLIAQIIAQLYGVTEKLADLTGLSALAESMPGIHTLPSLPRPAALSAAQLTAVTSTVAAQRRSIEAMQAQLQAFAEQLTVMEKILEPLTEWTAVWVDLEQSVMGRRSAPDA